MAPVFIAYSRHDIALVTRLVRDLETEENIDIWFPERDGNPDNVRPSILSAIDSCRAFLLCISQNTADVTAPFLSMEKRQAVSRHLADSSFQLITAALGEGGEVPEVFRGGRIIDLTTGADWNHGVEQLKAVLAER